MNAAQVRQSSAGEATETQQGADVAKATQRRRGEAAKTQIRARITHVGSEYRKDVTSGTCELCIADWSGRVLIALGILEAVEACTRASEMVERLDGTYIHDDDWDAVEP